MVAYENQNGNNENNGDSGSYRNSRYGLDLFVKDCLDVGSDYNARSNEFDSFYLKNRKNKEQKRYGPREETADPLELLASIPSIRSYGFFPIPSLRSGGNYDSSRESYSSSRGVADGDYSDNGDGASYAAADSGNIGSYSVN